jgi:hypothetical protein
MKRSAKPKASQFIKSTLEKGGHLSSPLSPPQIHRIQIDVVGGCGSSAMQIQNRNAGEEAKTGKNAHGRQEMLEKKLKQSAIAGEQRSDEQQQQQPIKRKRGRPRKKSPNPD